MISKAIKSFLLIFITSLFIACGGDKTNQTQEKEENKTENQKENDNKEKEKSVSASDEVSYALPSPLQIASIFKRSGLEYDASFTNPHDRYSNYNSTFIKKVNFGIYSADLAYSVLNNQNQAAINYVKSLSELSRNLWMINVFESASTLKRFEKNIGNVDSLTSIISDFQMELDDYLSEQGLSDNSLTIFAGAWIESMYIGSKVVEKNNNVKLQKRLAEQSIILNNLIKEMEKERYDINKELLNDLKSIDSHFKNLKGEELKENPEYQLSDQELMDLAKELEQIRNKYVKG